MLTGALGFVACTDADDDDADVDSTPTAIAAVIATPTQEVSPEEEAVQQVFLGAIDAWNADDIEAFRSHFTDEAFSHYFLDEGLVTFFVDEGQPAGSPALGNPTFLDTIVLGETATLDTTFSLGSALLRSKFALVRVEGEWRLNSEESDLPVDVPAGMTTTDVDLSDFAFGVDANAIVDAKGAFALEARNVGKQAHMLAIVRVPAGAKLDELLRIDPRALEFIATTGDVDPGRSGNIVFVAPLDAGQYSMVCFLFDTEGDGTPHFMKGMLKEFSIE